MVQEAAAAKGLTQLLVWAKLPPVVMLVMVSGARPLLVRLTGLAVLVVPSAWFPKLRLVGDRVTTGTVPFPVRLTECGLPAALSTMVMAPVLVPAAVGVNLTLMVQKALAAKGLTQLLVWAKSPLAVMLVMVIGALPLLLRFTSLGALVVPTG
jgi:hypothetical protein